MDDSDLVMGDFLERMEEALNLIRGAFRSPVESSYVEGKTIFRDFLYEKAGCSLMEAEALVDLLEEEAKIEFQKDAGGPNLDLWEIH